MSGQSSSDPSVEGEFAIDVYRLDHAICIDIEWVDVRSPERILLKLDPEEVRQLIRSLSEELLSDDSD